MKLVFVSSMLPSGHFSQILTSGLNKLPEIDLIVYADKNPENLRIKNCGKIKNVWPKDWRYFFQILSDVRKDNPDVVHIQQEFTMYGNLLSAVIFPLIPLFLRLFGFKVVVTIHAAVFRREVNNDFINLFAIKKAPYLTPSVLKLFFYYVYKLTSIFSYAIICHNELMKKILSEDWGVDRRKINVIETPVPERIIPPVMKNSYFFCYGYIVRRKGFDDVLSGFSEFINKNKKYKLVLAGGAIKGQEKAFGEIKKTIKGFKLESKIIIKGFVEDKDLINLYPKALAAIIPAKITMGSSGPLYHAQSFGKCILASNIGHFRQDIRHLVDGILVDNDKWDKAFEFVIKNPKLVAKIEKNVRFKAKQKNPKIIAEKHFEVYKKIA